MSIEKRVLANGKAIYDVVVYCESRDARGRRRKISRTAKNLTLARDLEATLKVEAAGGGVRDSRRTVEELMDAWLAAGTWSTSTEDEYRRLVKRSIRPALGTVKLDKLGARQLETLYKAMRNRGLSDRSVRNVHRVLSVALGTAVRWGWTPTNVAERAVVGHTGGPQGRVASMAEVEGLLAAADEELRLVIRLAAVTGARRSELCGLRWSDIDLDAGTLKIERALVKGVLKDTKNHQARAIPLDPGTLALLKANRGIGPIITTTPGTLSRRFSRLCKANGISGLGLHGLRHWCATTLMGTTDVKTVAGRLGHRDASVTLSVYAHTLAERDRAAGDALGKALGG